MSSVHRDIADALTAGLAAETFASVTEQPTVERKNWPAYDLEDMADPVIAVTPTAVTLTRTDRTRHQHDYQVSVFVGRHTPTEADADQMTDMLEEVVDKVRLHVWNQSVTWPAGVTSPTAVEVAINPDDALQERNAWRAVVTATYTVHR